MTFWERFYDLCESKNTKPNTVAKELDFSNATCTKWKNGSEPSSKSVAKIAEYFNVSTDYLIGNETAENVPVTDNDIKFALFNGSEGVTDEMFNEVKQFAEMVKMRENAKRKENK